MASIAALVAGFQRQLRNLPGPSRGASLGGVPFLSAQFPNGRVYVEAAFGANLASSPDSWPWVDITADVRHAARLRMRIGRADDTSVAQSASCGFDLDNTLAAYSAYNPASANYPDVRRNTPIRVRVDVGNGPTLVWQGYAVGWTPSWDTSAQLANVSVVAAGALRRLGQGNAPLRSALARSILQSTAAKLSQFWPCEDPSGSNQAGSAVSAGTPLAANTAVAWGGMDLHGSLTGGITLGAGTQFGYPSMPRLTGGGKLSATFPATGITSGSWTVQATTYVDPITNDFSLVMAQWQEGGRLWQIVSDGLSLDTTRLLVNGTTICTEPHVVINEDMIVTATQVGPDINVSYKPNFARVAQTATISGSTLAGITSYAANPAALSMSGDFSVGEIRIWDGIPETFQSVSLSSWDGWVGEAASDRLIRLCREEGIHLDITGIAPDLMGLQPIGTLLDILRECEAVDGGILYDGAGPGIGYICRNARYNIPASVTIDVSAGQLSPPFTPVDDDQRLRNDVTVSRTSGSSARYVNTSGPFGTATVGTYDTSVQVNTYADTPLLQMAAWQVALGTIQGLRYPNLVQDFAAVPSVAQAWISPSGPAFRVDVVNPSTRATQHPPDNVSLVVEGWSMNLDQVAWDLTASCSQFAPWAAAVFDSARYDSATSTLAAEAIPGATSLLVQVTDGTLWKQGAVSFDINVGGVRYTVSNISGASSPQTFTVGAPVNGVVKDLPVGTSVRLWTTPTYAR